MLDSITCPRCQMTSFSPKDIEEGYCALCCWWTADPLTCSMLADGQHRPGCDRPQCLGCRVDPEKILPV